MKGLSFSEPMVRAWLAGNKTVTRRLIKVPAIGISGLAAPDDWNRGRADMRMPTFETWGPQSGNHLFLSDTGTVFALKSFYLPGETVYIKETWTVDEIVGHYLDGSESGEISRKIYYKSDHTFPAMPAPVIRWKSPRFMPEWAARSHALIVSVRPERVQEITEQEAQKEGFNCPSEFGRLAFKTIWESLHLRSWEKNDWVWRIELEKKP